MCSSQRPNAALPREEPEMRQYAPVGGRISRMTAGAWLDMAGGGSKALTDGPAFGMGDVGFQGMTVGAKLASW